jgi:transposase
MGQKEMAMTGIRTAREATSDEVKELKAEARQLKETLAEVLIENRLLKKSILGDGEDAS